MEVAQGVRLATWTTRHEDVDSPAVVLVHGGPGLWSSFEDLVDLLTDVAVVHTYDQRGCGRSSPTDVQSIDATVADLEALRRHWGHDRWVVVGHSFGADVALAYAATHPDHTHTVGHLAGRGNGDRTAEKAAQAGRLGLLTKRHAELSAQPHRGWDEEVEWRQLQWVSDYADPVTGFAHSSTRASTDLAINFAASRALRPNDADRLAWAAATRCPVYFIHGTEDPRPFVNVLVVAAVTPQARIRIVQGGGHHLWVERPDETAALIHELVLSE